MRALSALIALKAILNGSGWKPLGLGFDKRQDGSSTLFAVALEERAGPTPCHQADSRTSEL
jgi:hypothetical protein